MFLLLCHNNIDNAAGLNFIAGGNNQSVDDNVTD